MPSLLSESTHSSSKGRSISRSSDTLSIYIVALEQESQIIEMKTFVIELQIQTSVSEIHPYPYHRKISIYSEQKCLVFLFGLEFKS